MSVSLRDHPLASGGRMPPKYLAPLLKVLLSVKKKCTGLCQWHHRYNSCAPLHFETSGYKPDASEFRTNSYLHDESWGEICNEMWSIYCLRDVYVVYLFFVCSRLFEYRNDNVKLGIEYILMMVTSKVRLDWQTMSYRLNYTTCCRWVITSINKAFGSQMKARHALRCQR